MSDRDATFSWETEALRDSTRRRAVPDPPSQTAADEPAWATLRQAHDLTGIPVDTLRKWARKGTVSSFLDESGTSVLRMVGMESVRRRAGELGRPIAPAPGVPRRAPTTPRSASPAPTRSTPGTAGRVGRGEVLRQEATPGHEPGGEAGEAASSGAVPEGTMIVPVAAWDKMLMQLGNLHEAGQQLADARERAAKAETEATFLRRRLGEMRQELEAERGLRTGGDVAPEAGPEPQAAGHPAAGPTRPESRPEKLWRYIYRGWKERKR